MRNHIANIIHCIEINEWNKAKSIWLSKILYCNYDFKCKCEECGDLTKNKTISTHGSEYEFFLEPIIKFQKYNLILRCLSECKMNGGIKESVSLHFKKIDDHVSLSFTQQEI